MATILIVDDQAVNREFLITLLGYHHHRLLEANDGARGLALARAERPDLVISDILMPTMDGYEFVHRLRADPALVATPVIFYTAHYHGPEAQKLAADCGVAYILTKPSEPELVLQTVAQALGQSNPPPSALSPNFDREHLQVLTDKLSAQVSELQRTTERFTALIEVTLQLASERDPRRLLDSVCHAARQLTAAKYAVLAVGNEDGTAISELTTSGLEAEMAARLGRPVLPEGPVRTALRQGKALRLTNPGGDPNAAGLPLQRLLVYALLVAPIVSLTRNYGWIALADKVGAKGFSAEDELLVAALGAQLGRFYENGSLYAEARRHAALLQESELRFRQLAENINEVFFLISADGTQILYISPAYEAVWDRSCESLYARPESWIESIHPDDREAVRKGNGERIQTGELNYTFRIVRPDGSLRWISARGFPIRNDAGEVYRIAGIAEDITERVRLENVLKEREAGLRRAQLTAKLAHVITRQGGLFESWSETLPSLIGVEPGRMPQSTREWLDIVHPDDRAIFRSAAIDASIERARKDVGYRLRRGDGAWIDVWQIIEPIPGGADDGLRWQSTLQDVTDQKQFEKKIRRLNRVYAVLSGINALIVREHDRSALFRDACRIAVEAGQFRLAWIGVVDREAMQVKPIVWHGGGDDYIGLMPMGLDEHQAESFGLAGRAVIQGKPMVTDDMASDPRVSLAEEASRRGLRSLAILPLQISGSVVAVLALYAGETGFFDPEEMKLLEELAGDIAFALDHIAKEEKLDYLAFYDPLTGVPNRNLFRERLVQQVGTASREHRQLAVVLLDIERFNTVNDTLGRQAGDELLKQIAASCSRFAADPGLFARLVGDQFAVAIPDVKIEDDVARIVELLNREIFGASYHVGDTKLRISAKFGIAMFPGDGTDGDTLLKHAEAALKRAKATGERYLFYTQQMTERVAGQLSLENKLRHALENDEFVLHYQPKVDIETRRIVGVEALMRWQSPDLGLVPPLRFIPLLEETGMILDVGAWALRRAALDHQRWLQQNLAAPRVAVNVSAIQLRHRNFVDVLKEALRQGVDPPAVDIELTESVIMGDVRAMVDKLRAIGDMGLNIAIDDFGTGYSSLAYLAKLPVHSLKIDRSFIITMTDDPDTMTLVSTIISLAHSLRLKVCAEGVETEEQAKTLRLLRCDEMQGYLISRPVPSGEVTPLLAQLSA